MNPAVLILAFISLTFLLGFGLVRWLARKGAAEYEVEAKLLNRIASLSIQEAAEQATALLADGLHFRTSVSPPVGTNSLAGLAPELRRIFERYGSIERLKGPHTYVDRSLIGPSAHGSGFIRIGVVADSTDLKGEISVKPGQEVIYELYANEIPDPTFGTYASVYHWVIAMAAETDERDVAD